MALTKLTLKPGINRDQTSYSSEGGWFDCDKIRFRAGYPEKIGGWVRYNDAPFIGVCRSLFNWATADGNNILGVATHKKMYIEAGGVLFDITPVRFGVFLNGSQVIGNEMTMSLNSVNVTTVRVSSYTPNSVQAVGSIGTVTVTT